MKMVIMLGKTSLFGMELTSHTTDVEEIFGKLKEFIQTNGIDWVKCVDVSTDGASAMAGAHKGVVTKIQQVSPKANFVHCSLHREALLIKRCPTDLKTFLNEAVKTVDFIKARALNS